MEWSDRGQGNMVAKEPMGDSTGETTMQGIVGERELLFWTLKSVCEVHNPFLVEKIPCDCDDLSVSLHRGRKVQRRERRQRLIA